MEDQLLKRISKVKKLIEEMTSLMHDVQNKLKHLNV